MPIETRFVVLDANTALTDVTSTQVGTASFVVIALENNLYAALPVDVVLQLTARLRNATNHMLANDVLRANLERVFGVFGRPVLAESPSVNDVVLSDANCVVVRSGKVVGVVATWANPSVEALLSRIGIDPSDLSRRGQSAKPEMEESGASSEVHEANGGGNHDDVKSPSIEDARSEPSGSGPEALPTQAAQPEREDIRLDAATPDRVTVRQPFDLAVAIRQPSSPLLTIDDLTRLVSATGAIFRLGEKTVKYRVEVDAKDCEVEPPSYLFYLERGKDSIVQYFQLTPRREGMLTVIVSAYQADDNVLAASTRIRLQASVVVSDPTLPDDQDEVCAPIALFKRFSRWTN